MKRVVLAIGVFALMIQDLSADLNGIINPIVVDSKYTFTDGETAIGFVSFRKGFDLPVGGTVTFALAPGMEIEGPVSFRGGTLRLSENVKFGPGVSWSGPGFIEGSGGNIIIQEWLDLEEKFTFLGDINMIGFGLPTVRIDDGALDISQTGLTSCRFVGLDFRLGSNNSFITSPTNLSSELTFANCLMRTGGVTITTFKNPIVKFEGQSQLQTSAVGKFIIEGQLFVEGRLSIASQTSLAVATLRVQSRLSDFIIDNAILDIVNTTSPSNTIFLGVDNAFQGSIVIKGQSIFRSSVGNAIEIPKSLDVEFNAGARLAIDSGTKVIIN